VQTPLGPPSAFQVWLPSPSPRHTPGKQFTGQECLSLGTGGAGSASPSCPPRLAPSTTVFSFWSPNRPCPTFALFLPQWLPKIELFPAPPPQFPSMPGTLGAVDPGGGIPSWNFPAAGTATRPASRGAKAEVGWGVGDSSTAHPIPATAAAEGSPRGPGSLPCLVLTVCGAATVGLGPTSPRSAAEMRKPLAELCGRSRPGALRCEHRQGRRGGGTARGGAGSGWRDAGVWVLIPTPPGAPGEERGSSEPCFAHAWNGDMGGHGQGCCKGSNEMRGMKHSVNC
jgi:hypothetical protein